MNAVKLALLAVAGVQLMMLADGSRTSCLVLVSGVTVVFGLGGYAAHRHQLQKHYEKCTDPTQD